MQEPISKLREIAAIAGLVVLGACSSSSPIASSSFSPDSSASTSPTLVASPVPSPSPSPSPFILPTPSPLPIGTSVQRQVLAPAKVLPVGGLCSQTLLHTTDGNVRPQFCRSGAVNVLAWRFYVPISSNVMSLGRSATLQNVKAAFCRDGSSYRPTVVEETYAYELSAAYYGWHFATDPIPYLYEPPNSCG
jgi:hypothetical protein